jgi:hypothetical protein
MPKLAPRPWDPVRVSTTDAVALLLLPPALTFVHPTVYLLASMDLRPPHPRQEFRKPPCHPPLSLLPMATTTPMTSAASKPQGNHHRSTTSRGPPRMCRRRPCRPGWGGRGKGAEHSALLLPESRRRSVRTSARLFPCHHYRRRWLGGGERPWRRLPGAEAATEEAAAAVIMTYFVVGCGWMLCFWFGGGVNYTLSVITRA